MIVPRHNALTVAPLASDAEAPSTVRGLAPGEYGVCELAMDAHGRTHVNRTHVKEGSCCARRKVTSDMAFQAGSLARLSLIAPRCW